MSIAFVQYRSSQATASPSTTTSALVSAQTAGDTLLAFISRDNASGQTITSVTDTAGNTYVPVSGSTVQFSTTINAAGVLYACVGCLASAANANSLTVTCSATTSFVFIEWAHYTGVVALGAVATNFDNSSGGSNPGNVSLTTTAANSVISAACVNYPGQQTATSNSSGFTERDFSIAFMGFQDNAPTGTASPGANTIDTNINAGSQGDWYMIAVELQSVHSSLLGPGVQLIGSYATL